MRTGVISVFIGDVKQARDTWGKSFTQYIVTVACGGRQWKVYKRYSEFSALRSACAAVVANQKLLPRLPGKKMALFMNNGAVQARRRKLELFLKGLLIMPSVRSYRRPVLLRFLGFLDAKSKNLALEEWSASYVSSIPPWLFLLKALLPSQGSHVPIGILKVGVLHARNLPRMDLIGSADPYVKLRLGRRVPQEAQTKVVANNLNPCWEETFVFEVTNSTSKLRIEIWDHDTVGDDDPIGYVDIALKYLAHGELVAGDFYLKRPEDEGADDADQVEKPDGDTNAAAEKKRASKTRLSIGMRKKSTSVWESKAPPRIRLQMRYSFSRLGELASHWNPEPPPPYPEEKFDLDRLYGQLKMLLANIQPIINFFYAFYMVLCWDDVYYSAWITALFVLSCFHTWLVAIAIQGWLIYYILGKYVTFESQRSHLTPARLAAGTGVIKGGSAGPTPHVVSAAPPSEPKPVYKLGMVGGPVVMAIKAAGMEEDMVWYQSKMATANWLLDLIYGLFDWSSPHTTRAVLIVLCVTLCYSLVCPVHYLSLLVGLYLLFMWTTPFMFAVWALSGINRYFGRERISPEQVQQVWKNVMVGARAMRQDKSRRPPERKAKPLPVSAPDEKRPD